MISEIKIFLIAMSPIVELRGAIPIALEIYKMPVWSAYIISVLGNLVPLVLIISILDPISKFLSARSVFLGKIFHWIFDHTKSKNQSKFEKWGKEAAVLILTAIPVPFVGGWTGALASFVFEVPFKKAFPLIVIGCALSGVIVTLLTLGIFKLI